MSLSMFVYPSPSHPVYCYYYYIRDDLARAIKKLRVLGSGFAVIPLSGRRLVQSVPGELNMDHTAVLQQAKVIIIITIILIIVNNLYQDTSYVSKNELIKELGWTEIRIQNVLVSWQVYIAAYYNAQGECPHGHVYQSLRIVW